MFLKNCLLTAIISVYVFQLAAVGKVIPSLKDLTVRFIATNLDLVEKDSQGLPNLEACPMLISKLIVEHIPLTSANVYPTIELAEKLQIELSRPTIDKIADTIARKLLGDITPSEKIIEEMQRLYPYQARKISFKIAAKLINAKSRLNLQEQLRIGLSLLLTEQKQERITAIGQDLAKKIGEYIKNASRALRDQSLTQWNNDSSIINETKLIITLLKEACSTVDPTPICQEDFLDFLHKNIAHYIENNLTLQQCKDLFKVQKEILSLEQICFIYIVDTLISCFTTLRMPTPHDHLKFHALLSELSRVKSQYLSDAPLSFNTTLNEAQRCLDSILQEYGDKLCQGQPLGFYVALLRH